jgi:hypothetical protein
LFLEGGGLTLRISYTDVQSAPVQPGVADTYGDLVLHLSCGAVTIKDCEMEAAFDLSALIEDRFP